MSSVVLKTVIVYMHAVESKFLPWNWLLFDLVPVNLCNLLNEKLRWTVSLYTISGWVDYNKWKCHHCLAISLCIISNHLEPLPSAAFKHAGLFKLYLKRGSIQLLVSSLCEIVTIMTNSPYEKQLIWYLVARSTIKPNSSRKELYLSVHTLL